MLNVDGWTDGRTNVRTDERTNERTYERTNGRKLARLCLPAKAGATIIRPYKNTASVFLTLRNHVKIFLSQNISHNVLSAVYRKTLRIGSDRTDKTVKTHIRLLSLTKVLIVCHFIYTSYCNETPNCSILGYFQYLFQEFQFLDVFT